MTKFLPKLPFTASTKRLGTGRRRSWTSWT